MTITRLIQAGAELQGAHEIDNFVASAMTVSSAKAHTGTYSFRTTAASNDFGFAFDGAHDAVRASYFLNHIGYASQEIDLFTFMAAGVIRARIYIDGNNDEVVLEVAGSEEDRISVASAGLAVTDTWLHLAATFHDGGPGFASLYVDGERKLNFVGSVTGGVDSVRLYRSSFSVGWDLAAHFDDIYVDDIEGESDSAPNSLVFLCFFPDGAGTNSAWTPSAGANYENVDEAPPDDDTTYNNAVSADLIDSFAFGSVTLPVDYAIRAVIPTVDVRKIDSATAVEINLLAFDGLTYLHGSDIASLPTSYAYRFDRFETQPDASAWDETDFNAMEFGYRSRGVF